ncbi:MAG: S9 family peptidase [Acidobacteria bacterium]|nr:S9 family peptidase [Acidobacteriota bacterium]
MSRRYLVAGSLLVAAACAAPEPPPMTYPTTRRVDHVDTYHGVAVPDPYRWLEDDTSAETAAWVEAQNRVTFAHLETIPFRGALTSRLEQLFNYPKFSAPERRGTTWFFSKNDGLQNQAVIYTQQGLDGTPAVLLDPNTLSPDGTTKLSVFSVSKDGRLAVYGLSQGGSDWMEYRVLDIGTRQPREDVVQWVKVSGAAWAGDGFFYSRYPAPSGGRDLSAKNVNHEVYFHKVGTPQSADQKVFSDPANPERFHTVDVTEDERFLLLTVSDRGKGRKGNAVFYRDLTSKDTTFHPIVGEIGDDTFTVIDNIGATFLVSTDRKAPNGRVFLFDPKTPAESAWKDVLPERAEPLDGVSTGGGKLFASYLKDVTSRSYVFDLAGRLEHEIALPGPGTVSGLGGRRDDTDIFYTYTSFNYPPTIFRYDVATKVSTPFREVTIPGFRADDYEVTQVFVTSRDGTKVPMFLTHKRGLRKTGQNPTLMYGYGGFNVNTPPAFSALRIALLEQGVVYASVNMRGGAEYGEAWHEAGTKLKKQNVFDDFIAAAEWLIASKYTSSPKLAMLGGSNGGLLVGAVMNQRPELFAVAIPQVGVMDMLRFHTFTIGWNWIADYGSSDDPGEFKALHAYSPLHNLKPGTRYPATLVTTADHDDRVVPAHSFKYAATLQAAQGGPAPVLIRVDTKSGHGASNTKKQIESSADIYAFVLHHLGVRPTL